MYLHHIQYGYHYNFTWKMKHKKTYLIQSNHFPFNRGKYYTFSQMIYTNYFPRVYYFAGNAYEPRTIIVQVFHASLMIYAHTSYLWNIIVEEMTCAPTINNSSRFLALSTYRWIHNRTWYWRTRSMISHTKLWICHNAVHIIASCNPKDIS